MILALTSESLPLSRVFEEANTVLAQKISQVDGVGQVFVGGGQQPAVRVQVDPLKLAGTGLSLEDVRTVIAGATVDVPKGSLSGALLTQTIGANDQLFGAKAFEGLVLRHNAGAALRLRDVAKVIDDVENNRVAAWADGRRAVVLIIRREPGANVIDVIARVRALLPSLAAAISPSIHVDVAVDRANTIRASVREVEESLLISVALVVLVVFAFLRSARATLIPSVAVPLSLVGTFGVMYLLDYSLDNLSLMALTISTGFVVDDAIVVTENIDAVPRGGHDPRRGRPARRQADRLHHRLDHRVAARGVHPDPAHGRHRRAPLPRVRRGAQHRHRHLGGGLAHRHPDDVRAAAPDQEHRAARPALARLGGVLRRRCSAPTSAALDWVLRRPPDRRPAHRAHAHAHRLPLRHRPEGPVPAAGHRAAHGLLGGAAGHQLPRDARAAARLARGASRPRRAPRGVVHRRWSGWLGGQHRHHSSSSCARGPVARRAPTRSSPGCARTLGQVPRGSPCSSSRCRTCASAGASRARSTSTRWRTRTSTSCACGARSSSTPSASCPSCKRRGHRPGERRGAARDRHRPRQREQAGHHPGRDRRDALRRVRPAPGRDDLHPGQSVPRGARDQAGALDDARRARQDLRAARRAARCRSPRSPR